MAITRSFGGQTLLKPGAYSVSRTDNAQSISVGDNDTIMLIGEATNGTSSNSTDGEGTSRVFDAAQLQSLVDYYVSGDIVDAALAAVRPSITPGVSGPGQFVIYKTNVGLTAIASLSFVGAGSTPVAGDILRFEVPVNASGESANVDLIWGNDIVVPGGSDPVDFAVEARAAIDASPALQNFFTATDNGAGIISLVAVKQGPQFNDISVSFLDSTGNIKDYISNGLAGEVIFSGGSAELGSTTTSQLRESFTDAFNFDPNVIVPLWSNADAGAGTNGTGESTPGVFTATGDQVFTISYTVDTRVVSEMLTVNSGANLAAALAAFKVAWDANSTLLADYTVEVNAGSVGLNFTTAVENSALNVTISIAETTAMIFDLPDAIITGAVNPGIVPDNAPNGGTTFLEIDAQTAAAQLQSHLIERSSTSVRKEAQGMIGGRFADWRASYDVNASGGDTGFSGITSFLIQAFIQDVRIINSEGTLEWKAPHIMAAMAAGIRLGTTVGEPLTFKFVNAIGVAHHVDINTGNFSGSVQFKPGFDFNVAILNGITFTELASGGNRIVVDNTRYLIDDQSFVFNRGSVIEAAQFVAKTSRQLLERIFVGQKVSNGAALSLKNVLRNYLIELNASNIITTSIDAPFGFVEETFTVSINGNTAEIQVEIKPVQGLDFIFLNFTLGNITQQA